MSGDEPRIAGERGVVARGGVAARAVQARERCFVERERRAIGG